MSETLTEQEEAALLVAHEGGNIGPIGGWKTPVENLALRGLLYRKDDFNYGITGEGRKLAGQLDRTHAEKLVDISNQISAAQAYIRAFAEPAAQLLAQAAQASVKVTGGHPEDAARKWSDQILQRAIQLLRTQPTRT